MRPELRRYAAHGHRRVQGWLTPLALQITLELAEAQHRLGIRGPVAEIGVHHGRFFILLHLLTEPGEAAGAWDLFERQSENVDGSGAGDHARFLRNLQRHGCHTSEISIQTENSVCLTPEAIVHRCRGNPRLFSIDGGHTAEVTYNDLSLAASSVCAGGLIIVDDFFNEAWPGVALGTTRFLADHPHRLVPVVIAGNKFFFSTSQAHAREYRTDLAARPRRARRKIASAFDSDVLCMTQINSLRSLITSTRTWEHLRGGALGRAIRRRFGNRTL